MYESVVAVVAVEGNTTNNGSYDYISLAGREIMVQVQRINSTALMALGESVWRFRSISS